MGAIRDAAVSTFRNYETDGLPATGVHRPDKADIRALFGQIESAVAGVTLAGAVEVKYATVTDMEADTGQADGTLALVWNDPTPENNGYYVWDEGEEPDAWVRSVLADPSAVIANGLESVMAVVAAGVESVGDAEQTALENIAEASTGFDVIPAEAGFEAGWVLCDENGWYLPGGYDIAKAGLIGPVNRRKLPGIDLSGEVGAQQIAPPQLPTGAIFVLDPLEGNGLRVPNIVSGSPSAFSGNIFAWPTGDIRSQGSTSAPAVTKFYATGPGGDTTAARVLWATTGAVFNFFSSVTSAPATTPPAGSYTARCKMKSNTGSSQGVRMGSLSSPNNITSETVTTSWQTFTKTVTGSGSDLATFGIYNDGAGNLPDILIAEIEVYRDGELPVSFADVRDWEIRRRLAHTGGLLYDADGAIDNVTGNGSALAGGYAIIAGPKMTSATAADDGTILSEWTMLCHAKLTGDGNTGVLVGTEADTPLGVTTNTLQFGVGSTGTLISQPTSMGGVIDYVVKDKGWFTMTQRRKNGEQAFNLNDMIMRWDDTAYSGMELRHLLVGGTATSTQWKGPYGIKVMWNRYLTDAEVIQANRWLRYRYRTRNIKPATWPEVICGVGDSRTAGASPSGDSFMDLQGKTGKFGGGTKQVLLRNFAVSGYGATNILSMLTTNNPSAGQPATGPGGIAARVAEIVAMGATPIIFLGPIGINDNAIIISGGASAYFTTYLLPIYQACKAMPGAVLVVSTELCSSITGWEAEKNALNALIRAASSEYDVLCDFDDEATMSDPASLVNATLWNTAEPNVIHPAQGGHDLLDPIANAALVAAGAVGL